MVIQVYAPTSNAKEAKVEQFYEDLQDFLKPTPKEDVLFIIGDWNAKVGSQENFLLGVTGKFGLGVQNEAGQRLIEFAKRMHWSEQTPYSNKTRELYTLTSPDGQNQNQIDYILCSQDGEPLYSQQKQDQEMTVVQIMNSLLPNSDLN